MELFRVEDYIPVDQTAILFNQHCEILHQVITQHKHIDIKHHSPDHVRQSCINTQTYIHTPREREREREREKQNKNIYQDMINSDERGGGLVRSFPPYSPENRYDGYYL